MKKAKQQEKVVSCVKGEQNKQHESRDMPKN